jgi:hypothetical protein
MGKNNLNGTLPGEPLLSESKVDTAELQQSCHFCRRETGGFSKKPPGGGRKTSLVAAAPAGGEAKPWYNQLETLCILFSGIFPATLLPAGPRFPQRPFVPLHKTGRLQRSVFQKRRMFPAGRRILTIFVRISGK